MRAIRRRVNGWVLRRGMFDPGRFSIFDVNAAFAIETIDDYEQDILPDNEADLREFCKMLLAEKMSMHACAEVGMRAMQDEKG